MTSPGDSDGDGADPPPFDPYGQLEPYDPDAILADPGAHPVHKVYAAINIRIRDHGESWSKCPNCGNPYQLTEEWSDPTVCSPECHDAYAAYVTAEAAAMPEFLDPRSYQPGYHGEGALADFDPGSGRSSQDDWFND